MSEPENRERPEETALAGAEVQEQLREQLEALKTRAAESQQAMSEGRGVLRLETPIRAGDAEITELAYDFTALTGMEYAEAMDSDANAQQVFRITYRQGLALFARAAAKQTDRVDMRDIMERIGVTDAVEGVQLAALFFSASARAGRMRISRRSSAQA